MNRVSVGGQRLNKKPSKAQLAQAMMQVDRNSQNQVMQVQQQVQGLNRDLENMMTLMTGKQNAIALKGDTVVIGYLGQILQEDGSLKEFRGGTSEYTFVSNLGAGSLIPGFEEQVEGKAVGSSFNVELSFPQEYGNREVAGKKAVFSTILISSTTPNSNLDYIKNLQVLLAKQKQEKADQAKTLEDLQGKA